MVLFMLIIANLEIGDYTEVLTVKTIIFIGCYVQRLPYDSQIMFNI